MDSIKAFSYYIDRKKEYGYIPSTCQYCGTIDNTCSLVADCHGDSLSLCKECWIEFLETEIFPLCDKSMEDLYTLDEDGIWIQKKS